MGTSVSLPKSINFPSIPYRAARHLFSSMSARPYSRQVMLRWLRRCSLTMIACVRAAMATASSTLVETSNMRDSNVPNIGCGRTSHQIFLPLSIQFNFTRRFTKFSYALRRGHELATCAMHFDAQLADVFADARAGFDDGLVQLMLDLFRNVRGSRGDELADVRTQLARRGINDLEFFFNADGEAVSHGV